MCQDFLLGQIFPLSLKFQILMLNVLSEDAFTYKPSNYQAEVYISIEYKLYFDLGSTTSHLNNA